MSEVTYRIVEHDGGYAYKVGDVFSETYPSHDEALQAAQAAAAEQQVPGSTRASATRTARATGTTRPRRATTARWPRWLIEGRRVAARPRHAEAGRPLWPIGRLRREADLVHG